MDDYLIFEESDEDIYLVKYSGSDESILIPKNIKYIYKTAFVGCKSIINIKFENGSNLTSIGENAFAYCRNLACIELPNSLRSIDSYSFSFCNSLTTIILPEGITCLGDDAFSFSGIKSIVIPKSVITIGRSVFDYYDKINTVYYTGTVEDWNKISIEEYNDKLTSSIIYYYSESQPTESGNYWHYVDGEVVIW